MSADELSRLSPVAEEEVRCTRMQMQCNGSPPALRSRLGS
jgi:hypothetical protein